MKVLLLICDGVSLRNYIYNNFAQQARDNDVDVSYVNATDIDLKDVVDSIKIDASIGNSKIDLLNQAITRSTLQFFASKFKEPMYLSYIFPLKWNTLKNVIKSTYIKSIEGTGASSHKIEQLRKRLHQEVRNSDYYRRSIKLLEEQKPDLFYSSTQRSLKALAPVLAAQDLGVKTICSIYSWDNVQKAMNVIETDYYTVWSDYMKSELLKHYDNIDPEKVIVTGTPQFLPHFRDDRRLSRQEFTDRFNLPADHGFLCFSGDDFTTSPYDHLYLRDFAVAVRKFNTTSSVKYKVLFRRVPVDRSDRYELVLKENKDIIIELPPLWEYQGDRWDRAIPTIADSDHLADIAHHCDAVCNLASTVLFDFALHNKPCIYVNYQVASTNDYPRNGINCYNYMHFKSMPNRDVAFWVDNVNQWDNVLAKLNSKKETIVDNAQKWFSIINGPQNPVDVVPRIIEAFKRATA